MGTVTSKDGTTIAFDRTGEGPPLITIDGATAYRAINETGEKLASLLAAQYTVFRYDRRGRGDSGETQPYAVEREIDDLEALIAEAGGSAFVVGGSSGGVLGLDAAAAGLGITKLAVYEAPVIVDDSRPPVPDDYVAHLDELVAAGRRGDAVEYFLTAAVGMPAEMVTPMRSTPMWPVLEAVAHTIAYDGRIMGDTLFGKPLPAGRWASVTVPTLVLDGGASEQWMHSGAEALAGVLPSAERRTLEGQIHAVDAEVLAPVLEEFFSA